MRPGGAAPAKLVRIGWHLSVYPAAREASGRFMPSAETVRRLRVEPGQGSDPERSGRVAASRARTKVRRYCAANGIVRLGTLTYRGAGCHDPVAFRTHVGEFFKQLRAAVGGDPFPYVWVPEWHKSGHGLHGHFGCGRYIKRSLIEEAWGHGFVHIKLLGDVSCGSGVVGEARHAAKYLSKYVGKDFDRGPMLGLHRYDRAQGFDPERVPVYGRSLDRALAEACAVMGGEYPSVVSTSEQWPNWEGPSAVALTWAS